MSSSGEGRFMAGLETSSKTWYSQMDGLEKPLNCKIHNFLLREYFVVFPSLSDAWLSWLSVKIGFMPKILSFVEIHSWD